MIYLTVHKNRQKVLNFGENKIEKHKLHHHKSPISIYDVDGNKTLVSNKYSFSKNGFKYFIGCQNGKQVRPLCIMFPKLSTYRRDFDETKYFFFDKK